jgi:hypothetical protein
LIAIEDVRDDLIRELRFGFFIVGVDAPVR